MKRRPSRQFFVVCGVGTLLVFAGATAQAGWLFVLAAGVLGLAGGSIAVRHRLGGAEVIRDLPSRARAGDDIAVRLTLRAARHSLPPLRVEDSFPALAASAVTSDGLASGSVAMFESVRPAHRRGIFEGGPVTLVTGAPFGFLRSKRLIGVTSPLLVLPSWVEITSFPIMEPSSVPLEALHERARMGAGQEFHGVREYRPGDSPRAVHWRSTARAGRLVVREFEEPAMARVAIVVAGADFGVPPDSAFEAIVSAAASIASYSLSTGHPIEVLAYGPEAELRRASGVGFMGALELLAGVEAGPGDLMAAAAAGVRSAGRRGTVVVCSSSHEGDELQQVVAAVQSAGCRAILVLADPASWDERAPRRAGAAGDGRTVVRVVSRNEDLARCLQA